MRTETLKVEGMTCGGRVRSVTEALKAVQGVAGVSVSLEAGEARIEFDENTAAPERLRTAIRQAGYEPRLAGERSRPTGGCCG